MSKASTTGLFLLLGLIWGGSFVAIEVGLTDFPPLLFAAFRFYVAGAVMLGYAFVSTDHWRPHGDDEWLVVGIAGSLLIAGTHAFLYLGVPYISGAVAAIIISSSPVLTAVFASAILGDRLTAVGLVGFACGLVGIGLVSQPDPSNLLSANVVGVGLVFVAATFWALGAVLTRPFRTAIPVQSLQAWAMLTGAPLLHVTAVARGESLAAVTWTPVVTGSLAYLGLIAGAVAFLIYFELLDRVGAAEINLIGYLEPVAATGLSYLLLDRVIGLPVVAGFVAIFVGFVLIKRTAIRESVVSATSL
ncbi:DMT family transporter [Halomicroarcula sp. GCM10025817]|uniref:DMT family transporter n=1 Tax=Haloarcula TaxID=2237 RepID=UPI0023E8B218|nr:DMT family transporter [Halomicroarcula sp. SYNS111]